MTILLQLPHLQDANFNKYIDMVSDDSYNSNLGMGKKPLKLLAKNNGTKPKID